MQRSHKQLANHFDRSLGDGVAASSRAWVRFDDRKYYVVNGDRRRCRFERPTARVIGPVAVPLIAFCIANEKQKVD